MTASALKDSPEVRVTPVARCVVGLVVMDATGHERR